MAVHNKSSRSEPRIAIENHVVPTTVTRNMSKKTIMANGIVLRSINYTGLSGVTISCSIVPISRSRTMAIDVKSRQMSMIMIAITPGIL